MRIFWIILAALLLYTGALLHLLLPSASAPLVWGGAVAIFWLMLSWQFLYRSHAAAIEAPWFSALAWSGAVLFGIWASFVLLSLPLNLAGLAQGLARGTAPDWLHPALQAALGLSCVLALVGFAQTLWGPVVRRIAVPVGRLHADLIGLTIAQISDLHVGPTIRRRYVERMVRDVLALEPDLIAITGDLADGHCARLGYHVAPLQELRAPLGIYFVTGNHEYYWGAEQWLAKVRELGAVALVDRNVTVARGGAKLLIGGVADSSAAQFIPAHRSDAAAAAAGGEAADFRLLLAHRPGACVAAEAAGFDLQLSGHTHGGQFFPFSLVVRLAHRYHRGLVRYRRMWLYVSAGTGYWGPPHRFWIPAEITLLRLVAAEDAGLPAPMPA
jgi:predicted MPP superfamily phosphohydrolase